MLPASEALIFAAEPKHEFNTATQPLGKRRVCRIFKRPDSLKFCGASASALPAFTSNRLWLLNFQRRQRGQRRRRKRGNDLLGGLRRQDLCRNLIRLTGPNLLQQGDCSVGILSNL